jgi:membrane-associated protein
MTDWFFAAVTQWGTAALALVTFLSCLAVPVPASLMMLAAGAFAASGDMDLLSVGAAALGGAILGDQVGFQIGWRGYDRTEAWLNANRWRAAILERARDSVRKGGGVAVFLSRWLFSALGPYVNLLAGAARMNWRTFTLFGIAGEMVWVVLYVGLGYGAGAQLSQMSELLGNITGLATSLLLTIGLGYVLLRWQRQASKSRSAKVNQSSSALDSAD